MASARCVLVVLSLPLLGAARAQTPWTWVSRGMYFETYAAYAFDAGRERTVGFTVLGTWELAGDRWLSRPSAHAPSTRHGHAMAWFPGTCQVVLFGGRTFETFAPYLNDTWVWDGFDWTLRAPAASPSPRRLAVMAADPQRDRIVLFGGENYGWFTDTWEWDGTNWLATAPPHRPPPAGRLAHDPARGRVALLARGTGSQLEHWEWDGSDWQQLLPAVAPPVAGTHALGGDPVRGRLVLLTGATLTSVPETWEWDGTAWQQRLPAHQPLSLNYATLVYDTSRRQSLLVGGYTVSIAPPPTAWLWDGTDWRAGPATPSPPKMAHATFAYDPQRRRVLAFATDLFSVAVAAAWEWDGARWVRRISAPEPFGGHPELAYDHARRETLLFGASGNAFLDGDETWSFDGDVWRRLLPATSPPPRRNPVMVADPVRRQVVLFGGMDFNTLFQPLADTWIWNGASWTLLHPANAPSPRHAAAATFDAARGVVVLFGGAGTRGTWPYPNDDTWVFDGREWSQQTPVTSPGPGAFHGMAFEPARRRVVLFGGLEYHSTSGSFWTTERSETWEWDGANWALSVGVVSPPGIARAVYEPVFARIMKASFTPSFYGARPASQTDVGSGCGGANGPMRLAMSSPELGMPLQYDVGARPGMPGLLVSSLRSRDWNLGGGCRLLVGWPLALAGFVADDLGCAAVGGRVPLHPWLAGVVLVAQGFALDPTAPLGIGMTQAVRATLGY